MMKQIMKVAVVNFHPAWGDKAMNMQKIEDYIELAAAEGVNLIVFPEMALTGYDVIAGVDKADSMQMREAELIPGPSTKRIAKLTEEHRMYAVFGMPERDPEDAQTLYNSVAILGPEGVIGSYRKMHCYGDENLWATKGSEPGLFDTPWGPVSVSICYDTYNYPELMRYGRAMGARLHVNATANSKEAVHGALLRRELEGQVCQTWGYLASANLCGLDAHDTFWGGSSIMGPNVEGTDVHYYAGHPYCSEEGMEFAMYTAVLDLSYADQHVLPLFKTNPNVGEPDFVPHVYEKMMKAIRDTPRWQALSE